MEEQINWYKKHEDIVEAMLKKYNITLKEPEKISETNSFIEKIVENGMPIKIENGTIHNDIIRDIEDKKLTGDDVRFIYLGKMYKPGELKAKDINKVEKIIVNYNNKNYEFDCREKIEILTKIGVLEGRSSLDIKSIDELIN